MISREEFDDEMAERDRQARLRAVAWDEAIGLLDDRMERLATSDRALAEVMQRSEDKLSRIFERLDLVEAGFGQLFEDYVRFKRGGSR